MTAFLIVRDLIYLKQLLRLSLFILKTSIKYVFQFIESLHLYTVFCGQTFVIKTLSKVKLFSLLILYFGVRNL